MPHTVLTITVERPINEVFDYVADIERLPQWVPVIQRARPTSPDMTKVGATYLVTAQVMGRTMEIPSEITGYEANRLYAYRSYGSLAYEDTMHFEETGTGTLITEQIEMASAGRLAQLLDSLKMIVSKSSHKKNLELLKKTLESRQAAVAA